jgi:hypothetical protein
VPWVDKSFFIPVVHSPPGAVGHVAVPKAPSQEGRALNRGTRDSTRVHLSKEARSKAMGHVTVLELTSARRRGPELRDTWRHRSSPQQGGEVRGRGTRGDSGAHLYREVWYEATAYMAAHGCMSYSLSLLRVCMWRYLVFRVPTQNKNIPK